MPKNIEKSLKRFIVCYGVEENGYAPEYFDCYAEDVEHAKEQTINAYPDCKIKSCNHFILFDN